MTSNDKHAVIIEKLAVGHSKFKNRSSRVFFLSRVCQSLVIQVVSESRVRSFRLELSSYASAVEEASIKPGSKPEESINPSLTVCRSILPKVVDF